MFQKDIVDEYIVLKRKQNSEEALNILKRLVSQVKPIIKKRNWKVRSLCEFFPKNPNLLGTNVNRGYKINLRLRPHYNENVFLEYNDILGTFLHELAHIVRGPHDEVFYKLLNELKEETEILMASGYSGEGFYSNGQRLGSTTVPLYKSRQAALDAAEKRRKLEKIMLPKGGMRLGQGTAIVSPTAQLTPAQMAASAAERRLRDQVWCGGSILIDDDDDDDTTQQDTDQKEERVGAKRKPIDQPESSLLNKRGKEESFIDLTDKEDDVKWIASLDKEKDTIQDGWICSTCTYLNETIVLVCLMCLNERPTIEKKSGTWTCPQCTLNNENKWTVCNACQYVYLR